MKLWSSHNRPLYGVLAALGLATIACLGGGRTPVIVQDSGQGVEIPTRIPVATPLPPLPTTPPPGSEDNPLRFLFVTDASGTSSRAEALAETFNEVEPDLVFDIGVTASQQDILSALCLGQIDATTLDALAATAANQRDCGEPLYLLEIDGDTSTQSQLITASTRGIAGVTAFAAQDFCRTDPYSVTGWIVPSLRIQEAGLDPLTQLNSIVTVEDDQEVIERVFNFTCDVGATTVGAELESPTIDSEAIRVLEVLPPVPNNAVVVSSRLDPTTSALIRDLIRDHTDEIADLHAADDLVIVSENDYSELEALLSSAGVDLQQLAQ